MREWGALAGMENLGFYVVSGEHGLAVQHALHQPHKCRMKRLTGKDSKSKPVPTTKYRVCALN
jgi:hypothetical protein